MFVGLLLFTIFLYIRPVDFFPALAPLHLTRTVALITFVLLFIKKKGGVKLNLFKDCAQIKLVTILFAIMILSILTSVWRANSIDAVMEFIKIYIGYILVVNLVDKLKNFKVITNMMVVCGFILALMAIHGYYADTIKIVDGRLFASFSSLVSDPNDFAQALLVLIPFSYMWLFEKGFILRKILSVVVVAAFLYAIVLTGSRGGLLGVVVIGSFIFFKSKHKVPIAVLVICAGIVFWNMTPQYYKERIHSIQTAPMEDESAIGRLNAWNAGWNMMSTRLLGVGAGNFSEGFYLYRPKDAIGPKGERKVAHNMYIQVGGEIGPVGGLIFILLLVSSFRSLNRVKQKFKKVSAQEKKDVALMADATFISLAGFCATGFFLSQAYSWFLYYLIGFSVVLEHLAEQQEPQNVRPPGPQKDKNLRNRGSGVPENSRKWKSRALAGKLNKVKGDTLEDTRT